ncbi:MAG: hypothetical protein HY553_15250 [Elusimicrobia bacterium]|nr:hypothetical protein [Elusimicrobiota bacterium]
MTKRVKSKKADDAATGVYRYDKALGKVVKVSSRVPGLSKSAKGNPWEAPMPSCPPEGCGRCH